MKKVEKRIDNFRNSIINVLVNNYNLSKEETIKAVNQSTYFQILNLCPLFIDKYESQTEYITKCIYNELEKPKTISGSWLN